MGRGTSRGPPAVGARRLAASGCGTDHVDLWQLHAWDPVTPWEEALAAVDTRGASGRVRYAGVSNYCGWQLGATAAWQRALPRGAAGVATRSSTPCCSAASSARSSPPRCELGVGLLPWSPLGRGVLTGKYRNGAPADSRGAVGALRAASSSRT